MPHQAKAFKKEFVTVAFVVEQLQKRVGVDLETLAGILFAFDMDNSHSFVRLKGAHRYLFAARTVIGYLYTTPQYPRPTGANIRERP